MVRSSSKARRSQKASVSGSGTAPAPGGEAALSAGGGWGDGGVGRRPKPGSGPPGVTGRDGVARGAASSGRPRARFQRSLNARSLDTQGPSRDPPPSPPESGPSIALARRPSGERFEDLLVGAVEAAVRHDEDGVTRAGPLGDEAREVGRVPDRVRLGPVPCGVREHGGDVEPEPGGYLLELEDGGHDHDV